MIDLFPLAHYGLEAVLLVIGVISLWGISQIYRRYHLTQMPGPSVQTDGALA